MGGDLLIKLRGDLSDPSDKIFKGIEENFLKFKKKIKKSKKTKTSHETRRKYNIDISKSMGLDIDGYEYDVFIVKNGMREILNKDESLLGYQIANEINYEDVNTNTLADRGIIHAINFLNEEIFSFFLREESGAGPVHFDGYLGSDDPSSALICVGLNISIDDIQCQQISDRLNLGGNDLFFVDMKNSKSELMNLSHISTLRRKIKSDNMNKSIVKKTSDVMYTGPTSGPHKNKLYNMSTKMPCSSTGYKTRSIITKGAIVIDNYIIVGEEFLKNYKGERIGFSFVLPPPFGSKHVHISHDKYVSYTSREYHELISSNYVEYGGFIFDPEHLSKPCKTQIDENIRRSSSMNINNIINKSIDQHRRQYIASAESTYPRNSSNVPNFVNYGNDEPGKTFIDHYKRHFDILSGKIEDKYGSYNITIEAKIGDSTFRVIEYGEKSSDGIFLSNMSSGEDHHSRDIPDISDKQIVRSSKAQSSSDKIRNPETGRPILINGPTYKQLIKSGYKHVDNILVKSE